MIAFYFHYAHRKSTKMIVSLRKWRFVNSRFLCSSKSIDIQSIVDFLFRIFDIQSINDFHVFSNLSTHLFSKIFTIIIFLNVETSLDKNKNKNYINNNFTFNLLTNQHSKHQTKNLNYVWFRFVNFRDLFVSTTSNEFVTMISEFASMKFY